MQTQLPADHQRQPQLASAAALIRRCVHCGFCNATCPTYQLLGDERDGPRGRIHLIKQMVEGQAVGERTRLHLDRCLTCRGCESTCPSGVEYGKLVDIGRAVLEQRAPRPWHRRLARSALSGFLTGPFFAPALRLGQWFRPLLPASLAAHVPRRSRAGSWPLRRQARRVLLLAGCVQPALSPGINAATARVLDALGIEVVALPAAGCCGAIPHHLDQQEAALHRARRNIDAWWPQLQSGVEAVVFNATGCGTHLREYGWLLRDDAAYAQRAAQVSALCRDVSELVHEALPLLRERLRSAPPARIAFHAPCSLQHGLKSRGVVEAVLVAAGAELMPVADAHLCCGSAGTYSLLQRGLSMQLRDAKIRTLMAAKPERVLSTNVGCIQQLGGAGQLPVSHWIEWLDARLRGPHRVLPPS
jgi:glycolate oxidase iron-sulfur subunit